MNNNYNKAQNKKRKTHSKKRASSQRKAQYKKLNYKKVFIFLAIVILIFYLLGLGISKITKGNKKQEATAPVVEQPKDITINMAVIGDIMCHSTNFADAYDKENNTYDFSYVFTDIKNYIQSADIAIGNLETTFAGKDVGYTGYPTFNTPEQLAQNLADYDLESSEERIRIWTILMNYYS